MSLIQRIRPHRTGIRGPLGDLEQHVMRCIWACGDAGCQASEVREALATARPVALTTVITTLDRLYEKGIVSRERGESQKAYRYAAAMTEEQIQKRIVEGVLGDLISQFPKAVAAYFAQEGIAASEESAIDRQQELAELARRLEVIAERQRENDDTGEELQDDV